VRDNLKKLVTAYNDVVKFIHERATFDPATSKAGILAGEAAVRTTLSTLRQAVSGEVPGLSIYTSVGQVGFKTERDGTLTLDEAKLAQALSTDYAAARALFIRQSTVAGVAQRVTEAVDRLDELDTGVVSSRKNSLTQEIDKMADSIQRKEDELAAYEARLRLQYAGLDRLLRQLQSQADFLRSRIA
jgi:flagellar hook-associated protein 2